MSNQKPAGSGSFPKLFPLIYVFFGFFLLFLLLLLEQNGLDYHLEPVKGLEHHSREETKFLVNKPVSSHPECLVIYNSFDANSNNAMLQYHQILQDLRVGAEFRDIAVLPDVDSAVFSGLSSENQDLQPAESFSTVVLVLSDLTPIVSDLPVLDSWVSGGGHAMIGLPLGKADGLQSFAHSLGISEWKSGYATVTDFQSAKDFMLGADHAYPIPDGYASSMNVTLQSDAELYAYTKDRSTPLIWSMSHGDGRYVVCNFSYCTKAYRGIYASAYSLLENVFAYPVINASSFYLDDFPSPVPAGDGQYIRRDYHMDIANFYSGIWWPDLMKIGKKYHIRYTGLVIENYNDMVSGTLPENRSTSDFYYYGNLLLHANGEIGFHGYNHQPLCEKDYRYPEDLGYKKWDGTNEMKASVRELMRFTDSLFPNVPKNVYVPPSNILSPEGRNVISSFPEITTISSCYLPGGAAYSQEFEIAKDGIIEAPRIISGGLLDDYARTTAFSELNFHFVNSHFMHPDDLLDTDRGASLGWETLKGNLLHYIDWLYRSAPTLRNCTGSEMASAVRAFASLTMNRIRPKAYDGSMRQKLALSEDAVGNYLLLRVHDSKKPMVQGAEATKLNETLYLLKITDETVIIR